MNKYWALFKAGSMRMISYKGPTIIWAICSLISLVTVVALWLSVSSGPLLAGYTKDQLITYAIVGVIASAIINFNPFPGAKRQIKDGSFATSVMLKPLSFYKERFVWESTWRIYFTAFNLITFIAACIVFAQFLSFSMEILNLPFLLVTVGGAIVLQFTLSMCLALLAFWFTEVDSLNSLKWIALAILGGTALPISFIPGLFQVLVRLLPFRYMYSLPMEIFFNKLSTQEIIFGIFIQVIWLGIFLLIYKNLYNNGIKKYVSVGQ